jgi:sterol desaturase/sphingolipid hydroxylase (fatty acid hydroxylase superfamily)
VFLTAASLIGLFWDRLGLVSAEPLIKVERADEPAVRLLQVVPVYLLLLFVADFCQYWFHRALHRFGWLWKFHAVHHSPRHLDALHNFVHPVESLGKLLLISVPTALLIGVDAGDLYILAVILTVQGYLLHMNVPLHFGGFGRIICDNRHHFIHHSRRRADFDHNFAAMFPVIDMLFGTYRKPQPGPLPETGFDDVPTRFSHYLLARWPGGDSEAAPLSSSPRPQPAPAPSPPGRRPRD